MAILDTQGIADLNNTDWELSSVNIASTGDRPWTGNSIQLQFGESTISEENVALDFSWSILEIERPDGSITADGTIGNPAENINYNLLKTSRPIQSIERTGELLKFNYRTFTETYSQT